MSRRPLPKFDRWPMPPTPACQIGPGWTELPWTTRWRRDARALLVVAMAKLMRLLPYGVACALGRCMGSVACRLNGALRRTALENLGRAFRCSTTRGVATSSATRSATSGNSWPR